VQTSLKAAACSYPCPLLDSAPSVEREVTLAERVFPLGEAFTERKLSATASRRRSTGEELFAESMRGPS
jgi:hypothetical protein